MQSLIRDRPRMLTVNLAEGKIIYGLVELDMHPARLVNEAVRQQMGADLIIASGQGYFIKGDG